MGCNDVTVDSGILGDIMAVSIANARFTIMDTIGYFDVFGWIFLIWIVNFDFGVEIDVLYPIRVYKIDLIMQSTPLPLIRYQYKPCNPCNYYIVAIF